jgi:hypothetical protein
MSSATHPPCDGPLSSGAFTAHIPLLPSPVLRQRSSLQLQMNRHSRRSSHTVPAGRCRLCLRTPLPASSSAGPLRRDAAAPWGTAKDGAWSRMWSTVRYTPRFPPSLSVARQRPSRKMALTAGLVPPSGRDAAGTVWATRMTRIDPHPRVISYPPHPMRPSLAPGATPSLLRATRHAEGTGCGEHGRGARGSSRVVLMACDGRCSHRLEGSEVVKDPSGTRYFTRALQEPR